MSKLRVLAGNDVYLPTKDGVVNCMRNYLLNYGDEVEATAVFPNGGRGYEIPDGCYEKLTYNSFRVPFSRGARFGFPSTDKSLKKILYGRNYDIIHLHGPFGLSNVLKKFAHEKKIPIVCTYHTNYRMIFSAFLIKPICEKYIRTLGRRYSEFDEVFAGTDATRKQLLTYGFTGRCSILPFGSMFDANINKDEYIKIANEKYGLSDDEVVFCFVGRLVESKRVQESIKALSLLKRKGYHFKFLVGGIGNYDNELKRLAASLSLEKDVVFLGSVSDDELKAIYSRSSLLLFPSLLDNFALVKIEAAACGTAGIYIKDSNTAFGTSDGVNSILCDDSPEDIAAKAELAFADPQLVSTIGKNANRDLVYTWKQATSDLVEKYREVIDNFRKSR